MPETILLHRVVSDIRQSEKARRTNITWARAANFRVRLRARGLGSDLGEDFPLNSVGPSEQDLPWGRGGEGVTEQKPWLFMTSSYRLGFCTHAQLSSDEFVFVLLSSVRLLFHCSPTTDDNKIMPSLNSWKLIITSF